jgi:DNA-directed RNA polymerase subunit omega
MARVTVEDCKVQVPNRFDLVILASQRAKQIVSGSPLTIARDNDKDTVVALRELAAGSVNPEVLTELQITALRKNRPIEHENEDEDEVNESMALEDLSESMGPAIYVDDVDEEEIEGFEPIDLDEEK